MAKDDRSFNFWQRWLTYANVLTIVVGLLVAFAGNSILFELHNDHTEDIFNGGKEFQDSLLEFKNWLFGIIGATIVGFHILMVMISENSFKKREKWAYNAMWFGLLSWFLIDSAISIYYGALHNVILINIMALILIGIPLVATRKRFKEKPAAQTVYN